MIVLMLVIVTVVCCSIAVMMLRLLQIIYMHCFIPIPIGLLTKIRSCWRLMTCVECACCLKSVNLKWFLKPSRFESTILVFGGACLVEKVAAERKLFMAESRLERNSR